MTHFTNFPKEVPASAHKFWSL